MRRYVPRRGGLFKQNTIIPEQQGVQAWDRYAYTNNNPIKYTDPSGHCGEGSTPGEGVSQAHHNKLCALNTEALRLSGEVQSGNTTDVEALASLMDFAAPLYTQTRLGPRGVRTTTQCRQCFSRDLAIVVGGIYVDENVLHLGMNIISGFNPEDTFRLISANDPEDPYGQYYIGYGGFTVPEGSGSGFRDDLHSGSENQVRHFMGGAAGGKAFFGLGRDFMLENEQENVDQNLFQEAFNFDDWLSHNSISGAGDWVRQNLSQAH